MGNYLNHGAVGGNAAAFKLNSLWKILEMKAIARPGKTLLHLVAQVIFRLLKKNPKKEGLKKWGDFLLKVK